MDQAHVSEILNKESFSGNCESFLKICRKRRSYDRYAFPKVNKVCWLDENLELFRITARICIVKWTGEQYVLETKWVIWMPSDKSLLAGICLLWRFVFLGACQVIQFMENLLISQYKWAISEFSCLFVSLTGDFVNTKHEN